MTASSVPLTIAVLAGGISHEREVSLRSGRRVVDELRAAGHTVVLRDPGADTLNWLTETAPDVVWPALHGASGEDGALQALLDARGLAYVGSDARSASLAWSKPIAKTLLAREGVATPEWMSLSRETFKELGTGGVLAELAGALGTPLVVKPSHGGSAQGVSIVADAETGPWFPCGLGAGTTCDSGEADFGGGVGDPVSERVQSAHGL